MTVDRCQTEPESAEPSNPWAQRMLADALESQKFTRKFFVVELDFSVKSLGELEGQFDAIRYALRGGASSENCQKLRRLWGAYLGEMLRRLGNGQWVSPPTTSAPDSQGIAASETTSEVANALEPLVEVEQMTYSPHQQIADRIQEGPSRNIVAWIKQVLGE
ncbi:MAG: hypothetical protein FJ295_03220 [Planctomycetes bacterium]|nr:hypothetical protein [Planctomycetota bacterium]